MYIVYFIRLHFQSQLPDTLSNLLLDCNESIWLVPGTED